MVHYNTQTPIVAPWSGAGGMQASIVLDQPGNVSFTNLDEISGKVIVRCSKSVDVRDIVVKLEGESRSRLLKPPDASERPKPQLEYHKILYKVQMVFPPADVMEGRSHVAAKAAYTLPPGQHEYPWRFKIPFNNVCHAQKSTISNVGVSNFGLEMPRTPTRHVHKTLPPTLSGFPGEAEIRYFVKATVGRHSFFKENPRTYVPFNFFPIEPPRPPVSGSQIYARQKHAFTGYTEMPKKEKMKSMFGMKSSTPASPVTGSGDGPFVSVDARLPEPAILTCNQDIPLSIIVKRLNSSADAVYLQSLQVSLIAVTKIRAHEVFRVENNSWIIMSKSNMNVLLPFSSGAEGAEAVVDDGLWRGQALPNTVAPTFETCNISRAYTLDVRVGLSYAGTTASGKPQTTILPLRLDTQIYSGIAPPPEILSRMAQARTNANKPSEAGTAPASAAVDEKLRTEGRKPVLASPTSAGPSSAEPASPAIPPRPGQAAPPPDPYDEAPPSYEDAIAVDLPPVDAPRPDYAPPPVGEDDVLRRDEKAGWV